MTWLQRLRFFAHEAFGFLAPYILFLMRSGGVYLITLAREAVAAAERAGGTGSQKKEIAIQVFNAGIKDMGWQLASSMINNLIETAVTERKLTAGP